MSLNRFNFTKEVCVNMNKFHQGIENTNSRRVLVEKLTNNHNMDIDNMFTFSSNQTAKLMA